MGRHCLLIIQSTRSFFLVYLKLFCLVGHRTIELTIKGRTAVISTYRANETHTSIHVVPTLRPDFLLVDLREFFSDLGSGDEKN